MGIPGPGLHRGFLQLGVSAFTMHNQFVPPPPPAVPLPNIPGLIEIPGFMQTPVSAWTAKAGTTVFFDGGMAVQEGHDMGFMIPHFAIPMNAMCGLNTLISKHKIIVPIGKVKVQGQNMGSYIMFLPGQICANPVSIPTAVVMLLKCTVWSTVSFADIIAAVITSIIDAALDYLWNKMTGGFPDFTHAADTLLKPLLREFGKELASKVLKDIVWEGFILGSGDSAFEQLGIPSLPQLTGDSQMGDDLNSMQAAIRDAIESW